MKTYSAGMRYGKVGKRQGRSKKKQVQKNGEWVEIPKGHKGKTQIKR